MKGVQSKIITIGDEILIGQIVDTNSAWLSSHLNDIGIVVDNILSISDKSDDISDALSRSCGSADIVIVTGGLGPTKDDITKDVICNFFDTDLVLNQEVLEHITELLGSRGVAMSEVNNQQAHLPRVATVLHNGVGTAAGLWLEKEGTIFIFMPGVPYEMKWLFKEHLSPKFKERFELSPIYHKTFMTQGIPESTLADLIEPWESTLPESIRLAYLPNPGGVRLRLSYYNEMSSSVEALISKREQELEEIIALYHYGYNGEGLAEVVAKQLLSTKKSVATAESCTGGSIASALTSVSGSSAYFIGGVVAYSNEMKVQLLGVSNSSIEEHGAVSQEVVEQMAEGVRRVCRSDYGIATSGITGPTGGTKEKPVGTVWVAIATPEGTISKRLQLGSNRERNVVRSVAHVLNMFRQEIKLIY